MKKIDFSPYLPHLKAIIVFVIISFLYFSPDIFDGKTLMGGDIRNAAGVGHEIQKYRPETGTPIRWTNSLFGGMPTYQMAPGYSSNEPINLLLKIYRLGLPEPVSYIFIMLLGFYILMLALKVRPDLSVLGAIAYTFSSYFFIIIDAGHIWKLLTLAYIPPTFAGVILAYRGKYIEGGILTALFLSFQIVSNHIQMSYYFSFILLAYAIGVFIDYYKSHQLPLFIKASITCCVAALLALAINGSNLFHTWEYSKETIRGKSELTHDLDNKTDSGLDRDYMVQWSYGIGETWTLLIPNVKGGSSGYLGQNDKIKSVPPEYQQVVASQNHYWGDQPFTEGPVYAGAFIMTLFILSLFILKTRLRWALLAVTILSILLAWGKNFMDFTNFFADYIPLYTKFRTVSSILVIAEITIPILAILALKEIVQNPGIILEKKKQVYISFALTGGLALLFALVPGMFFNFLSAQEADSFLSQAARNPQLNGVIQALESVRMSIFKSDAWRSVIIIAIGGGLLYLFVKKRIKSNVFVILLILLCIGDMWSVNKRYLNNSSLQPKREIRNYDLLFPKSPADQEILTDKDPDFRVLNTTVNTYMDPSTSYYHKSLGGYHAAKLRRYQELIEHHLAQGNMNVLNMLNTKYIIVPNAQKNPEAKFNPEALGNAWFIDTIRWVNNANEEIDALTDFNPHTTVFIDKRFEPEMQGKQIQTDSTAFIKLVSYNPEKMIYKSQSGKDGFGVFSEIYYPHGWEATIDGKPAAILRVNYVLRGLYIPAGEHEIVFTFKPHSITITEAIAWSAMVILLGAIIAYIILQIKARK